MILKNVLKKAMIVLTCIMLVFASSVKQTKAFALIDDLAVAAVLAGLCCVGGVVLSNDTIKSNVGDLINSAAETYADFYGGLYEDAKKAVTDMCSAIYDTGTVLASDVNTWLHGWLGNWINGSVLPTYAGTSFGPIFSSTSTFAFGDGTLPGHDVKTELGYYYKTTSFYAPYGNQFVFTLSHSITAEENAKRVYYYSVYDNGVYVSYSPDVNTTEKYPCVIAFFPTGGGGLDFIPTGVPIYLTGLSNAFFRFADGTTAFYNHMTDKWSRDVEGTLELDPDIFNKDALNDIDIAKPWADTYNELTKSIDYTNHWVLGNDVTFDNVGDMTFPGTVAIPKDNVKDYVDSKDYPLVIPTDVPAVEEIPKDTVIDKYPTWTPPNLYAADWSSVFPFCIPFDVFKFLELLSATPKAPHFVWNYNFMGNKGKIDINLDKFDDIAAISRTLFDVLFIVGLAMVTRSKLIRA